MMEHDDDDDDEKREPNLFDGKPLPRVAKGERGCGVQCDCGGSCVLLPDHPGQHECVGDKPGEPGTCPA